jgi:protein SCO1/2
MIRHPHSVIVPRQVWLLLFGGVTVLLTLLVSLFALHLLRQSLEAPAAAAPVRGGITMLAAPRLLADFTLPASTGEAVSLSDFGGRDTLLAFGYTHCPDVCPMTAFELARVRRLLAENDVLINTVLVSVDGERDTPQALSGFLGMFDREMVGLSGDAITLSQIAPDYGLFYQFGEADARGHYSVDHTASVYWIDSERRLKGIIAFGTSAETIASALREAQL